MWKCKSVSVRAEEKALVGQGEDVLCCVFCAFWCVLCIYAAKVSGR
jgi:hypothetical protein